MGQYMLMPLYVWNMGFVVVTCAMSPWIFNTSMFWFALIPTSLFLGASVLVELLMTGFRVSYEAFSCAFAGPRAGLLPIRAQNHGIIMRSARQGRRNEVMSG